MKKYIYIISLLLIFSSCSTEKNQVAEILKNESKEKLETNTESLPIDIIPVISERNKSVNNPMPQTSEARKLEMEKANMYSLSNGIILLHKENKKFPVLSIIVNFNVKEDLYKDKIGVQAINDEFLNTSTTKNSKEKLDEELDFMASNLNIHSNGAYAKCLTKNQEKTMEILAEYIKMPKFDKVDFDKIVKNQESQLTSGENNSSFISNNVESKAMYKANHPFNEVVTKESLKNTTISDCKKYYNEKISPKNTTIIISGNISFEEAKTLVQKHLGNWKSEKVKESKFETPINPNGIKVSVGTKSGSSQTDIKIANFFNIKYGDQDYEALVILNEIFGSSFSGRLFAEIREKRGYSYGAYSSYDIEKEISTFYSKASVRNEVTDSAIIAMIEQIKLIKKDGITQKELDVAKAGIIGNFSMSMEDPKTSAFLDQNILKFNLPSDYYQNYLGRIESITLEQVNAVTNKVLRDDNMHIILVGDPKIISTQLENKYNNIKYYDAYGNEIDAPKTVIDNSISEKSIIEKYWEYLGGKDNITKLTKVFTEYDIEVQPGMKINFITTKENGTQKEEVKGMGMTMSEEYFDGNKYTVKQMGTLQPEDEYKSKYAKFDASILPYKDFENNKDIKIKFEGEEKLGKQDCYILSFTVGNIDTRSYFDKNTGELIKEILKEGEDANNMEYYDYKNINGIKIPNRIIITAEGKQMVMNLIKSEVK